MPFLDSLASAGTLKYAGAGVVALGLAFSSVTQIAQTERGIDYTFGEMKTKDMTQLRQPGLSFKVPFISSVVKVPIDLQQRTYSKLETYTKDNQVLIGDLSVLFKIPEGGIVDIYKNNPNWEDNLQTTVLSSFKAALGGQEAQNVAQNRDAIMKIVTEETNTKVKNLLGLEVTAVQLPNFEFNAEFVNAVSKAANAKADLNRKATELEQSRIDAQKTVVNAQASADAQKKTAEGQAYAIEAQAKAEASGNLARLDAEAEGFKKVAQAIGPENMGTYLTTSKWNGGVPQVSGSTGGTIVDIRSFAPAAASPRP